MVPGGRFMDNDGQGPQAHAAFVPQALQQGIGVGASLSSNFMAIGHYRKTQESTPSKEMLRFNEHTGSNGPLLAIWQYGATYDQLPMGPLHLAWPDPRFEYPRSQALVYGAAQP
ncbi:MAG: hypothetical protein Q9224_005566, partial [Gallowayella concinna]